METTLNIRADLLDQITHAAKTNNISNSEMISILIQKVLEENINQGPLGKRVRYQRRRNPHEWRIFHVKIREDMYEYWLDLRKLLKLSVSFILAYAVKKYLSKLIEGKDTDNYHPNNYIIAKESYDNVIVWKLIWGFPPDLEKIINFS